MEGPAPKSSIRFSVAEFILSYHMNIPICRIFLSKELQFCLWTFKHDMRCMGKEEAEIWSWQPYQLFKGNFPSKRWVFFLESFWRKLEIFWETKWLFYLDKYMSLLKGSCGGYYKLDGQNQWWHVCWREYGGFNQLSYWFETEEKVLRVFWSSCKRFGVPLQNIMISSAKAKCVMLRGEFLMVIGFQELLWNKMVIISNKVWE